MSASDTLSSPTEARASATLVHDLRGPLVTMEGFVGEVGLALDELEALLREEASSADVVARLRELLEADLRPCLAFVDRAAQTLHGRIDALDTDPSAATGAESS